MHQVYVSIFVFYSTLHDFNVHTHTYTHTHTLCCCCCCWQRSVFYFGIAAEVCPLHSLSHDIDTQSYRLITLLTSSRVSSWTFICFQEIILNNQIFPMRIQFTEVWYSQFANSIYIYMYNSGQFIKFIYNAVKTAQ